MMPLPFYSEKITSSGEALILSSSENLTNLIPFGTCSDFCPEGLLVKLVYGVGHFLLEMSVGDGVCPRERPLGQVG